MKKFLGIVVIALAMIGLCYACNKEESATKVQGNTTVEELIKKDKAYFDNMAGRIIFYESRVVLDKPFNESDKFVAIEVTNIFQQNLDSTSNVYEFKHIINYGDVDVQVHKNASWFEDCPVYTDSLKLTFDQAYQRAKQSDLVPSKSRFIVLRNPLGPILCNSQYIIGNDHYGIMFVDGVTGNVGEKSPAFPNK